MINFMLNANRIKALAGSLILTGNISQTMALPCFRLFGNGRETYTVSDEIIDDGKIEKIELDSKKYISVKDFGLKDKNGNVYKKVDGVKVNGKIKNVKNLIDVVIGDDIDGILIGDELYTLDDFTFVDTKTDKELGSITGVILDNGEIIDIVDLKEDSDSKDKDDSDKEEEYVPLTEEKFYELVDAKIEECKKKGIAFDEREVESLALCVNINRLVEDNMELVYKVLGGKNLSDIEIADFMDNAGHLQDTFNSYNCNYFRNTKKTDGYILISDLIYDSKEKEIASYVEGKVNEIGSYARSDVDKMNELIYTFLDNLYNCKEDAYDMEDGTRYGLRYILRPIRDVYGRNECEDAITLDNTNANLIKYFVSYVGDENDYYINGWGTRGYQDVYGLLRTPSSCKVLTK